MYDSNLPPMTPYEYLNAFIDKIHSPFEDTRERFEGEIEFYGVAISVDAMIENGRVDTAKYECDDGPIPERGYDALIRKLDKLTIEAWKRSKGEK